LVNRLLSKGFDRKNIKVIPFEDIQGAEADYVIAYKIPDVPNIKPYGRLKEIYTLVTRGRYGFISFSDKPDIFAAAELTSLAESNVKLISTVRNVDSGEAYINSWKQVLDNIVDIEKKEPEQQIPENEPTDEPEVDVDNPEEEETSPEMSDRLKTAFGEIHWNVARQYGFYLGLSLNKINEITEPTSGKSTDIDELLKDSEIEGSPFHSFLLLVKGTLHGS